MKNANEIGILVNLGDTLSPENRKNMTGNIQAEYYFTNSLGESLEAIFAHKPRIALIGGTNFQACQDMIRAFRKQNPGIIILVFANLNDADKKKLQEKMHVFSIMQPQIDSIDLISILRKALAYFEEKKAQLTLREQSEMRMGAQAQWLLWKESQTKVFRLDFAKSLIRNILHSASQGLGVGAMITYVELLQLGAKTENGRTEVDTETFDFLVKNSEASGQWLKGFENILSAFTRIYTREEIGVGTISGLVAEAVTESERFRVIKNHQVVTEEIRAQGSFTGNQEIVKETIAELLLNAFKYSPVDSRINVTSYATEDFLALMVMNDFEIMKGGISGIPVEYQTRIFEPFFRLNNTWDDRYQDQKFGLGIGLTAAENAVQQCGGRLYLYEIEVHSIEASQSGRAPQKRIAAELILPRTAGIV